MVSLVHMGVWLPFGRRALKNQKLRSFFPEGDGTFVACECPGPQNYMQWLSRWKVFSSSSHQSRYSILGSVLASEKQIERVPAQWPRNWSPIAHADDEARAEA